MNYLQQNAEVTRAFNNVKEETVTRLIESNSEYVIMFEAYDETVILGTEYDPIVEENIITSGDVYLDIDAFLGLFKRSNSENEFLMELI